MAEKAYTLQQVEAEIMKIKNKYKEKREPSESICNKENLDNCLIHLNEELDYYDLAFMTKTCNIKSLSALQNAVLNLVNSTFGLLNLHKDSVNKKEELLENNCYLSSEVKSLKKNIDILQKKINDKEKQIAIMKEKNCLEIMKNDKLKNDVNLVNKEVNKVLKDNKANKIKHEHQVKRVEKEKENLENKFRKDFRQAKSEHSGFAELITEYKNKEDVYKDTILKLQISNHTMLEEILALKEKLSEMNYIIHGNSEI